MSCEAAANLRLPSRPTWLTHQQRTPSGRVCETKVPFIAAVLRLGARGQEAEADQVAAGKHVPLGTRPAG